MILGLFRLGPIRFCWPWGCYGKVHVVVIGEDDGCPRPRKLDGVKPCDWVIFNNRNSSTATVTGRLGPLPLKDSSLTIPSGESRASRVLGSANGTYQYEIDIDTCGGPPEMIVGP